MSQCGTTGCPLQSNCSAACSRQVPLSTVLASMQELTRVTYSSAQVRAVLQCTEGVQLVGNMLLLSTCAYDQGVSH